MAKTWGVPGKRQTYLSPGEQISKMPKVPLNANPLLSWDYKKSKYRRVDLFPKAVSENTQQGGVVPIVSSTPIPPSYFQFTVTSGATAQDACGSSVTFTIYTELFDDSACSADLSAWACMPQGTYGACLDPQCNEEIPNGFYASEFQPGVIGVYEYNGAFSNWSICPMVWSDADTNWNNESGTWDTV